jgi:hypothetical protein
VLQLLQHRHLVVLQHTHLGAAAAAAAAAAAQAEGMAAQHTAVWSARV